METRRLNPRFVYAIGAGLLLLVEVLIALFVRDEFIRPYGGDILVTVLVACIVRIAFPRGIRLLPVGVFLLAAAVEIGQYFRLVEHIGLGNIAFFRILLGTSFSYVDFVCYAVGCVLFWAGDTIYQHRLREAI